jgi:hypothetical protein
MIQLRTRFIVVLRGVTEPIMLTHDAAALAHFTIGDELTQPTALVDRLSKFGYFRTSIALTIWLFDNAAAQVALVTTTTMNEPAIPTGDVSQSSANPFFFSPS